MSSVAKSISKGFGRKNIFGNDSTLFTEESLDSSRKRKQSKASGSSVPSLPPRVALCVISRILQGFDPSCRAARECMIKSDVGSTALLNALEDSHHHAEEILRVNQVSLVILHELPFYFSVLTIQYIGQHASIRDARRRIHFDFL